MAKQINFPPCIAPGHGIHCLSTTAYLRKRDATALVRNYASELSDQCIHHHENMPIYFNPLKPHVYIANLWYTVVYIIFLISALNIGCGYTLELPRQGGSNKYQQSMFIAEI